MSGTWNTDLMPWRRRNTNKENDMPKPNDPPQPAPKGPCPSGGQHNWTISGHIRTCSKCGASENVG